tara:strand:- start:271 stop:498 length:228 start_codon:yes stop_codon:yes gene_type:complete
MVAIVIKVPKYLPHMQHKNVISMGLEPLDRRHWVEPDADYPLYLQHKLCLRQLQKEHIFDALPSAYEAQKSWHLS